MQRSTTPTHWSKAARNDCCEGDLACPGHFNPTQRGPAPIRRQLLPASIKKTLLRRRIPLGQLAEQNATSGTGEEFLLLFRRAEARVKMMLCSQTQVPQPRLPMSESGRLQAHTVVVVDQPGEDRGRGALVSLLGDLQEAKSRRGGRLGSKHSGAPG